MQAKDGGDHDDDLNFQDENNRIICSRKMSEGIFEQHTDWWRGKNDICSLFSELKQRSQSIIFIDVRLGAIRRC